MVREHGGDGEIVVPPTIHALLQARIDSLDGDVRVVMERGSVEGEVFHRGAVAELSPGLVRADVESHLTTLVRKELIRSTAPTFPEDEGYRFRHLLIRDAAYESLPKATRAELHEQFADWLSTHDLVEGDEIVGYHLEQAHRYRMELDPGDGRLDELSRRASSHLADAGRGALERGDYRAALSLLRRASDLLDAFEEERHVLASDLVMALWESGELERARAVASAALDAKDPVVAALATICGNGHRPRKRWRSDEGGAARAGRARPRRPPRREPRARPRPLLVVQAGEEWLQLHAAATAEACERGLEHFERSPSFGQSRGPAWLDPGSLRLRTHARCRRHRAHGDPACEGRRPLAGHGRGGGEPRAPLGDAGRLRARASALCGGHRDVPKRSG